MPRSASRLILSLLLIWAAGSGCAQCRIPAIDPTGTRIFSGTTTLNSPADCPFRAPKAAWSAPPLPPVCGNGNPAIIAPVVPAAVPVVDDCPDAYAPNLSLTPQRFVAPVGTDVVLVAGMCGADHHGKKHHYVMRQPLEWMLAPEGVGYIVEVGKENCALTRLVSTTPKKVDTTYALAHTSTIRQLITRGTGRAEDDIEVAKGQSWVSVSSPNEGVSYVTVLAPAEQNWDKRKQTATIYWIDAKWTFPAPVVVRPSEKHRLTTKIVRSNGLPVPGWIVRYDILEGPPAAFGGANEQTIEVVSDLNGEANVELLPQTKDAGISQIRIQIVRPDPTKPAEAPMLVGQGFTQVQWSTPGLVVRGEATQRTGPDGRINYRLEVLNNGDQLTRDVVLAFTPPQGIVIDGSNPQAQTFGDRLEWRLGNLAPGAAQVVSVLGRGTMPGDFQSCFTARSAEGLQTPPTCFTTNVAGNALRITVQEPANLNVNVGELVQYRVEIMNSSSAVVAGLRVTDAFDPGLAHFDSSLGQLSGEASPIDRPAVNLGPGETQRFALTFRVTQPGQQCHRLEILADNGQRFAQQYCVRSVLADAAVGPVGPGPAIPGPAVPAIPAGMLKVNTLAKTETAREGEVVEFQVQATNAGSTPLTNVRLNLVLSEGLTLNRATTGAKATEGQPGAYLVVARIDPGQTAVLEVECRADAARRVGVQGSAQADGMPPQPGSPAEMDILPGTPAEPPPLDSGANVPMPINPAAVAKKPAGQLKVSFDRNINPVRINKDVTFKVDIANQGAGPDQNVAVRMKLPPGLKFVKVSDAPAGVSSVSKDVSQVEMDAIQEVRAGEPLAPFKFLVQGTEAGEYIVEVEVTSASHPEGIVRDATLRVIP